MTCGDWRHDCQHDWEADATGQGLICRRCGAEGEDDEHETWIEMETRWDPSVTLMLGTPLVLLMLLMCAVLVVMWP